MEKHIVPDFTFLNAFVAAGIAVIYMLIFSRVKEPDRQKINALIIAGAGAAYLRGGFGAAEFAFCGMMTVIAFKGTTNYRFIALGWLLHVILGCVASSVRQFHSSLRSCIFCGVRRM